MSNFRVGQRVVCVDSDFSCRAFLGETYPKKGEVYTVRQTHSLMGSLRLVEIVNPEFDYSEGRGECWFRPYRFRPAVTRKTDISIFKAMLNPQKRRTDA